MTGFGFLPKSGCPYRFTRNNGRRRPRTSRARQHSQFDFRSDSMSEPRAFYPLKPAKLRLGTYKLWLNPKVSCVVRVCL